MNVIAVTWLRSLMFSANKLVTRSSSVAKALRHFRCVPLNRLYSLHLRRLVKTSPLKAISTRQHMEVFSGLTTTILFRSYSRAETSKHAQSVSLIWALSFNNKTQQLQAEGANPIQITALASTKKRNQTIGILRDRRPYYRWTFVETRLAETHRLVKLGQDYKVWEICLKRVSLSLSFRRR